MSDYGHAAFLTQKPAWLAEAWAEIQHDTDEQQETP